MRAMVFDARRPELVRVCAVFAFACIALFTMGVGAAHAATFDPNFVLSNDQLRHYDSMSQADIQKFLDSKPGVLKSLETTDYAGHKKKASRIIYEACRNYRINPRVMLVLLQKEQSLITRTTLTSGTLSRAVGAGCPDGKTNKYPGFGKQIWNGARLLDGYGEGKTTTYIDDWKPGTKYDVYDGSYVTPKNIATFKLYVYNPSIGAKKPYGDLSAQSNNLSGNASYWYIWRRWFGSPTSSPSVRPVYRFYHKGNGSHVLTSSQYERYTLLMASSTYKYQGQKFTWRVGAKANKVNVYRFTNKIKHTRIYTSSSYLAHKLQSPANQKTWKYDGVSFKVQSTKTNGTPIYKFRVKSNNTYLYTAYTKERDKLRSAANQKYYVYKGVAWYIAK